MTLAALIAAFPATASATERAWMRTGPLNSERTYPVAVTLADGRALMAGGGTDTAEIFDPAANRWSPVAPMANWRRRAAGVTLRDGRVLIAGGDDYARTAEVYDPRANAWTPTDAMIGSHEGGDAVLLADGRVLVVGGSYSSQRAEVFSPATNEWTQTTLLPRRISDVAAARLPDGRVLIVADDRSTALYDPAKDSWTAATATQDWHSDPRAAVLPDGRVLVAGGDETSAELFDPSTGTWTLTGSLLEPHWVGSSLVVSADGIPVMIGAAFNGQWSSTLAERYDVATGTWTPTAPMAAERWGAGVTALTDGSIVAAGGYYAGTISERFVIPPKPVTDPTTPGPASPPVLRAAAPVPAGVLAFVKPLPRKLKPKRATITVKLRCSGGACRDTLKLMRWHTKLATGAIVAANGQTATVKLKLAKSALRKLKHHTTAVSLELARSHLTLFAKLKV